MLRYAIIVAGGSGSRMGTAVPKQFLEICGLPVILHSCAAFLNAFPDIRLITVIPSAYINEWKEMCALHGYDKICITAEGGPERYHSVKSGLKETSTDESLIAVHDSVRPCLSKALIVRAFDEAEKFGAAIPVVPLNDSIREKKGVYSAALDRRNFMLVQTPQCFRSDILKRAYLRTYDPSFTDDASLVEASGVNVRLFDGETGNIKITREEDLIVAEYLLSKKDGEIVE